MTAANTALAELLPVTGGPGSSGVNVFIHGYRSLSSAGQIDAAKQRVAALNLPGRSCLLNWSGGRWRQSFGGAGATIAGLRAAYRVAHIRKVLAPWMLLVDAGVIGLAEVAQFKWMESRAERLGGELTPMLRDAANGEVVNLIGHSLGARVIHRLLGAGDLTGLWINDVVLLGGAADLEADDWPACIRKIEGRVFNAYSPRDRILQITPDLRRRIGGRPMTQVVVDGVEKVVNQRCDRIKHVEYWTRLDQLLPQVWPLAAESQTQ